MLLWHRFSLLHTLLPQFNFLHFLRFSTLTRKYLFFCTYCSLVIFMFTHIYHRSFLLFIVMKHTLQYFLLVLFRSPLFSLLPMSDVATESLLIYTSSEFISSSLLFWIEFFSLFSCLSFCSLDSLFTLSLFTYCIRQCNLHKFMLVCLLHCNAINR